MLIPSDFATMSVEDRLSIIQLAKALAAEKYPTSGKVGWNIARVLCSAESATPQGQYRILKEIRKQFGI